MSGSEGSPPALTCEVKLQLLKGFLSGFGKLLPMGAFTAMWTAVLENNSLGGGCIAFGMVLWCRLRVVIS